MTPNFCEERDDLSSFEVFIRSRMRREPSNAVIVESRDNETSRAIIEAAISGHVLAVTVHANDVAATMGCVASRCLRADGDLE